MIVNNKSRSLRDDKHNLLQEWNDTDKGYPLDQCLHELIEKQVSQHPDAEAIRFEEERLCYSELNNRSNQCAHYLRAIGIGPNKIVGIMMERSIEMIVALLGVFKSLAVPTYLWIRAFPRNDLTSFWKMLGFRSCSHSKNMKVY